MQVSPVKFTPNEVAYLCTKEPCGKISIAMMAFKPNDGGQTIHFIYPNEALIRLSMAISASAESPYQFNCFGLTNAVLYGADLENPQRTDIRGKMMTFDEAYEKLELPCEFQLVGEGGVVHTAVFLGKYDGVYKIAHKLGPSIVEVVDASLGIYYYDFFQTTTFFFNGNERKPGAQKNPGFTLDELIKRKS